jgi:hypothetical protein
LPKALPSTSCTTAAMRTILKIAGVLMYIDLREDESVIEDHVFDYIN